MDASIDRIDREVWSVLEEYHRRLEEERPRMLRASEDRTFRSIIDEFLLPVGPESGRLIHTLAKSLKTPTILELGTSYGYSTIWLAAAAQSSGGRVVTMELSEKKSAYAREMAKKAGLADVVDFRVGDAVAKIGELGTALDFVLVDLWKNLYVPCLEAFYPKLSNGAIIVTDNMIDPASERDAVMRYQKAIRAKPGITSILVPVGSGLEISRYEV
jgi:predicted O-methyltransferase YrrM